MASNLLYLPFLSQIMFLLVFSVSCSSLLCNSNETSALLQFKQSFVIDSSASILPSAYPKVASWKNDSNCCLWDGVECDEVSGHVVGLDLSSSYLFGSINSNSSLFHLVHLRSLNLADNNFNLSQIPSKLGNLLSLTYLNLSKSSFYGQVPVEITELSNLTTLDLGWNHDDQYNPFLNFKSSNLKGLVQNLQTLEKLDLSYVSFFSTLPDVFANLSSLRYLNLRRCDFHGVVPSSLSGLTKIRKLNLARNNLSGEVPSWLGNFTQLEYLDLEYNNFTPGYLSWLGNQNKLSFLSLSAINLIGPIPPSLSNLTQLTFLWMGKNALHGPIPMSIFQLENLQELNFRHNYFVDSVMLDMFTRLKHLKFLDISANNLTLFTNLSVNATFLNFDVLGLGNCNLREFPSFIRHQERLSYLDLAANKIEGLIPNWMGKVGTETLHYLGLSENLLNGIQNVSIFSSFNRLSILGLGSNNLEGTLPHPPLSIQLYDISYNSITGVIPELFCNLTSLIYLDLSGNSLRGIIPECLVKLGGSLLLLDLSHNSFGGTIPEICPNGSSLMILELNNNQLEGRLPRSLTKCTMLEILQVENNHIRDTFPLWLGNLPKLQVLILRENHFYGTIENHSTSALLVFPMLRILDLSNNEFTGILPLELFQALVGMRSTLDIDQLYMQQQFSIFMLGKQLFITFAPQLILLNKGLFLRYWKIPVLMAVIDISSNEFQGNIPKSTGTLKMLNVLNFSNNNLSGHIPSVIGNLTKLESLDLSCNNLSGMIPSQLTQLTFLEYLNVSNNQLVGPIPQGKQFSTFDNSSYRGNSGLCDSPLTKTCKNSNNSASPHQDHAKDEGSNLPINVDWKIVLIGYGSGLVVGVLLGLRFSTTHRVWLSNIFGINLTHSKRRIYIRRTRAGGIH